MMTAEPTMAETDSKVSPGRRPRPIELVTETIAPAADGVLVITFRSADGGLVPGWAPGAHISLQLHNGLQRQYSLCGDLHDRDRWQIAVLQESESRGGSLWLHTRLREGHRLLAEGPYNNFALANADEYILVAGGIGITPLLPMVRELDRRGAKWRLLYGGRRRAGMAFIDALEAFGDRVVIRSEDEHGLLDLSSWISAPKTSTAVYCCGPERLLQAVEAVAANWPDGALHMERFRPRPVAAGGESGSFEVILAKSGQICCVGANETIIEALDRIGLHVPRSCGEGACGTCLTKVIDGIPDHRDSFLIGKKRSTNTAICICCSRSKTPQLTLDL